MGRRASYFAVALAALALASSAQAKPLLGITGNLPHFQVETGQASSVHQAFLGWCQGYSYGSPYISLFNTLTPIPMIHLGTEKDGTGKEAITPAGIAAGRGDACLFGLNAAIAQWGKGIYVRPMAEMNNYENIWSGFEKSGTLKPGHSPADYRKAFQRIYFILHGGSETKINAKLKKLGMPPIARAPASNPFPRLRLLWSPLAGGNPRIAANAPQKYYPGRAYVDVEGADIFDEQLTDTAPWSYFMDIYKASVGRRPFAVPEWGLFGIDDPTFVKHVCSFLSSNPIEEAGFYESKVTSIFDLQQKPMSKKEYTDCVTPLGAPLPAWAAQTSTAGGGTGSTTPTITFMAAGQTLGVASAPIGADEIELDIVPATGVIAKAYWIRGGKALGPMTVPTGATGALFETQSGGSPPTPLVRPRAGTDFHVKWDASDTITSAWWSRVGKLLAPIPVTPGETSIAMMQGT